MQEDVDLQILLPYAYATYPFVRTTQQRSLCILVTDYSSQE